MDNNHHQHKNWLEQIQDVFKKGGAIVLIVFLLQPVRDEAVAFSEPVTPDTGKFWHK